MLKKRSSNAMRPPTRTCLMARVCRGSKGDEGVNTFALDLEELRTFSDPATGVGGGVRWEGVGEVAGAGVTGPGLSLASLEDFFPLFDLGVALFLSVLGVVLLDFIVVEGDPFASFRRRNTSSSISSSRSCG